MHDKAERAMRKATILRSEVSRSRYEHWIINLKLAKRLKFIFNIPGIKRAYKRLLTKEGKIEADVFSKILTVRDLATVMGEKMAIEAILPCHQRKFLGTLCQLLHVGEHFSSTRFLIFLQ